MTVDYTQPPHPTAPPQYPGQPPQPQKKSGCWKWGLLGCGLAVIVLVIVAGGIMFAVFGLIKQTYIYKDAVHRAQTNPQVVAALGTPIGTGFWVSGSVHTSNDSGSADVKIPIQGPKGKANIHCVATMTANNWSYDSLTVEPENGPPIDLLHSQ